ncbi:MAG: T9SS type A sorting domain-containing protein [Chitinophagales bacterium]
MKRQFIFLILVLLGFSVWAQTFVVDEDSVFKSGYADNEFIIVKNNLETPSDFDTVRIRWERIVEDIPSEWGGTRICDNKICHGKTVGVSPIPAVISGEKKNNIDVYFIPDSTEGEGVVHLRVWNEDNPSNSDTLVFTAKAEGYNIETSTEDKISDNPKIKVYPNPARDFIYLRDLPYNKDVNVEVYNILGRKMLSESFNSGSSATEQRIDINDLQKGIYLVRVFDDQMNIIATHSISKVK